MKHHRLFTFVRTGFLLMAIGSLAPHSHAQPPGPPGPVAQPQASSPPPPPGVPVPGGVRPPGVPVPGVVPGQPRPPSAPGGVPGSVPQPVLTQGDYSYTISYFNEATIVGFNKDFKGALTVIDTLGGCPVSGIARGAFSNATGLTRVTIPARVSNFMDPKEAFVNCPQLTSIDVDPACPNLSSADGVLFNKDQTTLMFCPRGKTGSYTIPASVTKIEPQAFSECKSLTALTVEASSKTFSSLDGVLFNKEQTTLTLCLVGKSGSYKIPAGTTHVADRAFMTCTGLKSVTISNSVTQIGNSAFFGCTGLENIDVDEANQTYSSLDGVLLNKDQTALILCPAAKKGDYAIPAKVTSIDFQAFTACTSLTRVTIPDSVTSISISSFHNCAGLTSIDVAAANKSYSSLKGSWFSKDLTSLIRCPRGKTGEFVIPPGVSTIGSYAFSGCTGLTHVTIPESVTYIEFGAFQGCEKLTATIQAIGRISAYSSSRPRIVSPPPPANAIPSTSPGAPPPPYAGQQPGQTTTPRRRIILPK